MDWKELIILGGILLCPVCGEANCECDEEFEEPELDLTEIELGGSD